MRQTGVSSTPERSRRARGWVDFGVDGSWERAAPRRLSGSLSAGHDAPSVVRAPEEAPLAAVHAPVAATGAGARAGLPAGTRGPSRALAETPTTWSHASAVSTPAPRPEADMPGRRTVVIRGRGAERDLAFPAGRTSRRPATRPHERPGFKPDRAAMWAILLGIFLVLVAATSSHAATLRSGAGVYRTTLERPAARVVHVTPVTRR